MLKNWLSYLLVLCLLLTLAACGGNPPTADDTTTTTTGQPDVPADPPASAIAPTFGAMPQKTQEMVETYRLSDTVVLFAFITPGMDAAAYELVCYDMATDTLLGQVDLGECWISIFSVEDGFAVLDYNKKSYTTYDTACAMQYDERVYHDGMIANAVKNGDRLLFSDLMSGHYVIYHLGNGSQSTVDTSITAVEYVPLGVYQDGYLLRGNASGLVYVNQRGEAEVLQNAATGAQIIGSTYTAGVVGDEVTFYPLDGGEAKLVSSHGEEHFWSANDRGYLSVSGKNAYLYNLLDGTVATYAADKDIVAAFLTGDSIVLVLREDYGKPLIFSCVDVTNWPTENM